jgi:hypothetical protein
VATATEEEAVAATEERDPELAETRFLGELRDRVAWQATAAERARLGLPLEEPEPEPEPEPEAAADREPEPQPVPEPDPEPEPPLPAAAAPVDVELDLGALEQIAASYPEGAHREELRVYLRALRPFANTDGRLPEHFGELVRSVFGA